MPFLTEEATPRSRQGTLDRDALKSKTQDKV